MDLSVTQFPTQDNQEQQIRCKFCEFKCDEKIVLLSHLKTHLAGALQKNNEGPNYTDPSDPTSCKVKLESEVITCGVCEFTSSDNHLMDIHMNLHAKTVINKVGFTTLDGCIENNKHPKSFKCDQCHFLSTDKSILTIHKVMHNFKKKVKDNIEQIKKQKRFEENGDSKVNVRKPFSCEICFKSFTAETSLKIHMRLHTGVTPYRCHICNRPFSQKSHLDIHMKRHTGEKNHKCKLCDYATRQISNLISHMRNHTGVRPYSCDICGLSFKQKMGLNRHRNSHSGEKPFKCLLCDFSCHDSNYLLLHTRVHTREKPYKCPECNYSCVRRQSLKSHRLIHSNEKPYKCEYCEHAFRRRSDVPKHMKKKHPGKPIPELIKGTNMDKPVTVKKEKITEDFEESKSREISPVC